MKLEQHPKRLIRLSGSSECFLERKALRAEVPRKLPGQLVVGAARARRAEANKDPLDCVLGDPGGSVYRLYGRLERVRLGHLYAR